LQELAAQGPDLRKQAAEAEAAYRVDLRAYDKKCRAVSAGLRFEAAAAARSAVPRVDPRPMNAADDYAKTSEAALRDLAVMLPTEISFVWSQALAATTIAEQAVHRALKYEEPGITKLKKTAAAARKSYKVATDAMLKWKP